MDSVLARREATAQIYAALDHVWVQRGLPSGHIGAVHKAVETLKSSACCSTDRALAERIAISLHRIHVARAGRDAMSEEIARSELHLLGHAWMRRGSFRPQ